MSKKLRLSVLDQSPVRRGGTASTALQETVELAILADRKGYTRYWVSEHHNTNSLAGSSPEVLIAHLANHTKNIRLGSGGIMLPNHSALKVAENFRLLESLFPGRIDLGLGRAPGGDRLTSAILNPSNHFNENDFTNQLEDLQNFLNDTAVFGGAQLQIKAIPIANTQPAMWMLTSSGHSGVLAAHFGMALSFAHFINPVGGAQVIAQYYAAFKPSDVLAEPEASIGIFAACADTEEKSRELQAVMDWQLVNISKGVSGGFPSYSDIKSVKYSSGELETIQFNRRRMVCGTPELVKKQIENLAGTYNVPEVVVATITYDFEDRLRSYELLADAFELKEKAAVLQ